MHRHRHTHAQAQTHTDTDTHTGTDTDTETHMHRHRHTQAHACTSSDLCSISLWPSTQVQQTLEPLAAVMKAKSAVSNLV